MLRLNLSMYPPRWLCRLGGFFLKKGYNKKSLLNKKIKNIIMKILVSGSLAYDKIMNFSGKFAEHILPGKIHVLNVSFPVDDLKQNFGGTAGNIAYNLKLLGEEPIIFASAGNDFDVYAKWLKKHNIDFSGIKIIKNQTTACAHIITDKSDNQITGFHFGAMQSSAGSIPDKLIKETKLAIISPGNIGDMVNYSKQCREKGLDYIFDPGQAIPAFSGQQLKKSISGAKVFIVNDYEMSLTLKKIAWDKKQLKKKVEIIITTLGDKGSVIEDKGKIIRILTAKPKNISDPTGAGDAYRAGLIKGLANNWDLKKAGQLAATVSAYTVEKYGTQTHSFSLKQLAKRFKDNFNEEL